MANKVEQVKQMTTRQLNNMDKQDLIKVVEDLRKEPSAVAQERMTQLLETISTKLDGMQASYDTLQETVDEIKEQVSGIERKLNEHSTEIDKVKALPDRVGRLEDSVKDQVADIYTTWEYMQRFIEGLDAHQRGHNIIIKGISEESEDFGLEDVSRAKHVIEKTTAMSVSDIGELVVKRLGDDEARKPRPLFVKLDSHQKQWKIIQNAKNLKDLTGYTNIYIQKDMHPTIRYEFNRLRRKTKELKDDAANQGTNIVYDHKLRVIKRDGIVIDRFRPSFP